MLKSLLTFALLQLSIFSYSQLPTLDWFNSSETFEGAYITSDLNGNVYMMGSFNGTRDFDPGPGITILTSISGTGNWDSFLSKFDSDGNFLWVKQWGFELDEGDDFAFMTDSIGNIYIIGEYGNAEDFDPGTSVFNLVTNSHGGFLIKLNSSGEFLAGKRLIDCPQLLNFSIHVMPDGEITVAGNYSGIGTFISGEVKTSAGRDHFLISLDSGLNYQWLKCWGGPVSESLFDHKRDDQGNIYLAGSFNGTTDLDPGIGHAPYPTNGNNDIVFSKLTSDGELTWAKVIGSTGEERALKIGVDYLGNVYIYGVFTSDTVDFNPAPSQTFNLMRETSGAKMYTAKYTTNGEFQWANAIQVIDPAILGASYRIDDFSVDTYGNSYQSGSFKGIIDFDPTAGTSMLNSNGDLSFYIRKMNPSGELSYAFKLGSSEYVGGRGPVCLGLNNSFYSIGLFDQTIDFEPGTGVFNVTPTPPSTLQYLLKMNECSNGSIERASECQNYNWPVNNTIFNISGRYSHILSNQDGCDSIMILDLTINPNTSVAQSNSSISAELSGATYQWIHCDSGNSISEAVNQSFSPTVNGSYAVIVTQNGCSDTSSCITISVLNLNEVVKDVNWIIYPNPAHESVKLFSEQDIEYYSIRVLDLNGQAVTVNMISDQSTKTIEMNVSQLPNGVYFVNIISEKENRYLKFIKI